MCIFSVLAPIQIKHIGNMDPTVPVIMLYNYFHLGCHKYKIKDKKWYLWDEIELLLFRLLPCPVT